MLFTLWYAKYQVGYFLGYLYRLIEYAGFG